MISSRTLLSSRFTKTYVSKIFPPSLTSIHFQHWIMRQFRATGVRTILDDLTHRCWQNFYSITLNGNEHRALLALVTPFCCFLRLRSLCLKSLRLRCEGNTSRPFNGTGHQLHFSSRQNTIQESKLYSVSFISFDIISFALPCSNYFFNSHFLFLFNLIELQLNP